MNEAPTTIHVRRAVEGDTESLGWVVERFSPFVESQIHFRLGQRGEADIEDLVADVWLVTLQRMGDLVERDGRFAPVLVRFLGTTALNRCNSFLRTLARRSVEGPRGNDTDLPIDRMAAKTRGMITRQAQRELADHIRSALDEMVPERRNILVLRLLEHRSNQEIARLLDLAPNTVAVRYARAVRELRARLSATTFAEIWSSRAGPEEG